MFFTAAMFQQPQQERENTETVHQRREESSFPLYTTSNQINPAGFCWMRPESWCRLGRFPCRTAHKLHSSAQLADYCVAVDEWPFIGPVNYRHGVRIPPFTFGTSRTRHLARRMKGEEISRPDWWFIHAIIRQTCHAFKDADAKNTTRKKKRVDRGNIVRRMQPSSVSDSTSTPLPWSHPTAIQQQNRQENKTKTPIRNGRPPKMVKTSDNHRSKMMANIKLFRSSRIDAIVESVEFEVGRGSCSASKLTSTHTHTHNPSADEFGNQSTTENGDDSFW